MNLTIFGKKRTTREGKSFTSYLTTLTKKNGEKITVAVKFRNGVKIPAVLPCNIIVEKENANLAIKAYLVQETGEYRDSNTLWISDYTNGEPYVDHSLDEFDF